MNEEMIKEQITEVSALMCKKNFAAGYMGGISVRLDGEQYLISPGNLPLKAISPKMLIKLDKEGAVLKCTEGLYPGENKEIHLDFYKKYDNIRAVINAFPSAFSALYEAFPEAAGEIIKGRGEYIKDKGLFIYADDINEAYYYLEETALKAEIKLKKFILTK